MTQCVFTVFTVKNAVKKITFSAEKKKHLRSAAQKAGIQAGDIITKVGEYAVTSVSDLTRVLRKFEAGQTVTVEIYRSGQSLDLSVVLDVKPREETQPAATQPSTQPSIQQPNIPNSDDFEDWYEFFQDYFG